MSTYTRLLYHMVWGTKHRTPAFFGDDRREMHRYLFGILRAKECHVFRIGGVEEHVHILVGIHQSVRIPDLVRDAKASSSKWLRSCGRYPQFTWWQEGLSVFSVGWREKDALIEYIRNQEEHHKTESFLDEYKRLIREAGLESQPRVPAVASTRGYAAAALRAVLLGKAEHACGIIGGHAGSGERARGMKAKG